MGASIIGRTQISEELPLIDRLYLSNLPPEKPPEETLAALLNSCLTSGGGGVFVNPRRLRLSIRQNWSKYSYLAHKIHEQETT